MNGKEWEEGEVSGRDEGRERGDGSERGEVKKGEEREVNDREWEEESGGVWWISRRRRGREGKSEHH